MSDPRRACEAFQSVPTFCPFGGSLQLSPMASPLQGEASQPGREESPLGWSPQRQSRTQQEPPQQLLHQAHIFWCLLFFSFLAMSPLLLFFSCEGGNFAYESLFVVPAVHAASQTSTPIHLNVMCSTQMKFDDCPKGRLSLDVLYPYRTPFLAISNH